MKHLHLLEAFLLILGSAFLASTADISDYKVGVGDILHIMVYQYDEMSGDFQVSDDGSISYPLLGTVNVLDQTVIEIASELEKALEKDYFVDVQLSVDLKKYHSRPVTVLGEVNRPGTYYLSGDTTLVDIIAEAGGLRGSAGPGIEVRRLPQSESEEVQVVSFSTGKVMSGEEGQDFDIQSGDVVSVSAKQLFFITGEVKSPGQYEIARGLTLMQALSRAGGQGKFASQQVEIHRDKSGEKEILEFDLKQIRKAKIKDPAICAGDVIRVKRRFF